MIKAGRRIMTRESSCLSLLISGLGGKDDWQEHAKESARVINAINPDYLVY